MQRKKFQLGEDPYGPLKWLRKDLLTEKEEGWGEEITTLYNEIDEREEGQFLSDEN